MLLKYTCATPHMPNMSIQLNEIINEIFFEQTLTLKLESPTEYSKVTKNIRTAINIDSR